MRYPLCSLIAVSAAVSLGTIAGAAHALTCEAPGATAPAWESIDVPTNTLIWCTRWVVDASFQLHVTDAQGQVVSGTQTLLTSTQFQTVVFRPDTDLAPGEQYSYQCNEFVTQPISFTTGAGPRNEPPALPNLERMQLHADPDSGWGERLLASFPNISARDTIVVLDIEGGPALDAAALSGGLDDVKLMNAPEGTAFVGRAPCVGNWPDAALGAATRVRFGAYDLTGAFSGWTDWKTVTLPDQFEEEAGEKPEPVTPTPPSGPAPDGLPGSDGASDEPALTGNEAPSNEVVSVDLASDSVATPAHQSSGCQLGGHGGSSWGVGLLAALACGAALRRRRKTAAYAIEEQRS